MVSQFARSLRTRTLSPLVEPSEFDALIDLLHEVADEIEAEHPKIQKEARNLSGLEGYDYECNYFTRTCG